MGRHDEHLIAPGVRGWLESPAADAVASDCVMVAGWAFASGAQIVDVHVKGLGAPRSVRYGLRRDDVASAYPDEPHALNAGFAEYLEFTSAPGERPQFELWATLDDGRSIRLFKRRLHHSLLLSLLLSPRAWGRALARRASAWLRTSSDKPPSVSANQALAKSARTFLENFLATGSRLTLARPATPVASVVVVVWNQAHLTLTCLRALAAQTDVAAEVIVVDNASTDETSGLLDRVTGAYVIRNATNLGFTVAANVGARAARGEFLLFLNNDAELLPGSIQQLLDAARGRAGVGAVGGKLVFPDGRLQEAGSIVWSDGSCDAYGRGADPTAPEYNFERRVDFCSAALLLTPRATFESLGGFDERYKPAYYEDADYCVRLWEKGHAVIYQPKAAAIHHEFGSALSRAASLQLQLERQAIFVSRHGRWLSAQFPRSRGVLAARSHPHGQPRVAVVDDAAPDARLGAGFPRAAALLRALTELGYLVTVYAIGEDRHIARSNGHLGAVEVVGGGPAGLRAFFTSGRRHDLVIVSRPHNMQHVKAAVGADLSVLGAPCVYDAEAVYALRDIGRRRLAGEPMPQAGEQVLIDAETALTRGCSAVLVVSAAERRLFEAAGAPHVCVVGHADSPSGASNGFERRRTILFVGAFGNDSPNEDAIRFFCREALPALRAAGCDAPIVVAGARMPDAVKTCGDATVSWHSDVDDLTPFYDEARVFVAPTRYGAGIPHKVTEAAARGIPVVASTLLARQLGWTPGVDLLAADDPGDFGRAVAALYADPQLWTRVRDSALGRVAAEHSPSVFRDALRDALRSAGHGRN